MRRFTAAAFEKRGIGCHEGIQAYRRKFPTGQPVTKEVLRSWCEVGWGLWRLSYLASPRGRRDLTRAFGRDYDTALDLIGLAIRSDARRVVRERSAALSRVADRHLETLVEIVKQPHFAYEVK